MQTAIPVAAEMYINSEPERRPIPPPPRVRRRLTHLPGTESASAISLFIGVTPEIPFYWQKPAVHPLHIKTNHILEMLLCAFAQCLLYIMKEVPISPNRIN